MYIIMTIDTELIHQFFDFPKDWRAIKLSHCATRYYAGATPESGNSIYYCESGEGIALVMISDMTSNSHLTQTSKSITELGRNSKKLELLPPGTLLISMYASVGTVAILQIPACINQAIIGFEFDESVVILDYAFYYFQYIRPYLLSISSTNTQANLNAEKLFSIPIFLPSIPLQNCIVEYLNLKMHEIKVLILQKQKASELYEEYKRAVIQQAVTRGLDPDVPLKPSGFEWLGDIPEHWEVCRLKSCVSNVIAKETGYDRGICLALEHVEGWTGKYWDAGADFVLDSDMKCFQPNDVLFGKLRPYLAKVARPDSHGICVGEFLVLRPLNDLVSPEFLEYLLRSQHTIDAVNASTFGARMPRADWQFIGDMHHAFPLPAEQAAIVAHLDKLTSDIDAAIAHTRREIELLEEYRTRLIADVVTGKLDVREAAANLPDVNLDDIELPAESGEADD